MKSVSPLYTALQGFGAFIHRSEVMMSSRCNIMSEMILLDSIVRLCKYLPITVKDGNNEEAIEQVAFGMAGITMQLTRITARYSIEHTLSATAYHRKLPHELIDYCNWKKSLGRRI